MHFEHNKLRFVLIGLVVAFPGEFVNNFLVMDNAGNFIFAMGFYSVALLLFFFLTKKCITSLSVTTLGMYMVVTGIAWGLILNEWIIIGNHPFNPSTSALISQISMIAFHLLVYTIPFIVIHMPGTRQWLRKIVRGSALWFLLIVFVGVYLKIRYSADIVLAWTIITTYFLGYLPIALYVVYRSFKDLTTKYE